MLAVYCQILESVSNISHQSDSRFSLVTPGSRMENPPAATQKPQPGHRVCPGCADSGDLACQGYCRFHFHKCIAFTFIRQAVPDPVKSVNPGVFNILRIPVGIEPDLYPVTQAGCIRNGYRYGFRRSKSRGFFHVWRIILWDFHKSNMLLRN